MRKHSAYFTSRGACLFTAAVLVVFSLPTLAFTQQNDKDQEIARLKTVVEAQTRQLELLAQQQKAFQERVLKEIETLTKTFRDRELLTAQLELDKKALKIEAVQQEARAKAATLLNERLLEQVRELEAKLAGLQPNEKNNPAGPRPNLGANPPPGDVRGKIEKIEGDLIQLNIGSDQGLNKEHTLEVYRVAPEAKYLGMIRIVEVTKTQSIARLVVIGNAARATLKIGDEVASRLAPK